jgi:release factor glutamine methyltransferase
MIADTWIRTAVSRLKDVERPRAEARLLLAHAMHVSSEHLFSHPEIEIPNDCLVIAEEFVRRRANGEPLSRILGYREFWSLLFAIGQEVLDPRPDTEILVEAGLDAIAGLQTPYILDLGTGSGCILLALLSERKRALGLGLDRSKGACKNALLNSQRLGLSNRAQFVCGDWAEAFSNIGNGFRGFDLVVSNPPYVGTLNGPRPDKATEQFDPPSALYAGPDGLDAYGKLAAQIPALLAPGGVVVIEIGEGQSAEVTKLFKQAGFIRQRELNDIGNRVRCLTFKLA